MEQEGMKKPAKRRRQHCRQKYADKGKCGADRPLPPTGQRNRHHQQYRKNPNGHVFIKNHPAKNARRKWRAFANHGTCGNIMA
jgi:hypothetical protein